MAKFRPIKFMKDKKKNEFLNNIVIYGTIEKAAEMTGIARQTHYDWRKNNDEYCMRFDEAMGMRCDNLEDAAYKRAVEGIEVNDYYKGEIIGSHREYSDTLLAILLKANLPHKYKDRVANEVTNTGEAPAVVRWKGEEDDGSDKTAK